jgi:molybdate transport system substrate-binding protein
MTVRVARLIPGIAALACVLATCSARAGEEARDVRVAVAANFKQTTEELCRVYFLSPGSGRCVVTAGGSGLLFAKVSQGAPFDVFLSADRARAERLETEGLAVPGTRFTYAIGRLAFWRPGRPVGRDLRAALSDEKVRAIAIANPGAAPYGIAALESLRSLGITLEGRYRIVQGESVAQAFQFVASGAADAGFVAWSQVLEYRPASGGSIESEVLLVDPGLHRPIEQQGVLLQPGRANAAARGLLEFMRSSAGRRIIESAGYASPAP